jgi:A/G-specific adenine glycosylase
VTDPSPAQVAADRRRVFRWYAPRGELYPWRTATPDPYLVLVSEVMLQQTQAPRVAPIFEAFVARFPDVRSLAGAARPDVVRAWAGLGYHRRAVALHEAAREIRDRHGGAVPRSLPELRSLPGVGPYTASAVASIAFGAKLAAVDTNVRRIAARYFLASEPDDVPAAHVAEVADAWVPRGRPGDWNQALMDLGRTVCRPTPRCDECPLRACRSRGAVRHRRRSARTQAPFEGSMRQVRGRVLASVRAGPALPVASLARDLALPLERVADAVDGLVRDGLATSTADGRIRLAD